MINKNAENRDKWFARFMCVFIACCLWIYVMSEQNPIVEKEFAIPLASRNLAEGMIVFNVPEKVSVRVRGTRARKRYFCFCEFKQAFCGYTYDPGQCPLCQGGCNTGDTACSQPVY